MSSEKSNNLVTKFEYQFISVDGDKCELIIECEKGIMTIKISLIDAKTILMDYHEELCDGIIIPCDLELNYLIEKTNSIFFSVGLRIIRISLSNFKLFHYVLKQKILNNPSIRLSQNNYDRLEYISPHLIHIYAYVDYWLFKLSFDDYDSDFEIKNQPN